MLELARIGAEGADALGQLFGRHLVLVELEAEGFLVLRHLDHAGRRRGVRAQLALDRAVGVGQLLQQLRADGEQVAAGQFQDPGVQSVKRIYNYYRKFGYKTEVMGASFRNTSQILELAGCDLLTISPDLLQQLADSDAPVERKLSAEAAPSTNIVQMSLNEEAFRFMMNEDAMATEKLAEGIRAFCVDSGKLKQMIAALR